MMVIPVAGSMIVPVAWNIVEVIAMSLEPTGMIVEMARVMPRVIRVDVRVATGIVAPMPIAYMHIPAAMIRMPAVMASGFSRRVRGKGESNGDCDDEK